MLYENLVKPIFFKMDPEQAHHVMIKGLSVAGKIPGATALLNSMYGVKEHPELAVDLLGIHFHNPIGLAAGLDKNGVATAGFSNIGFGFMEVGTVTPKGQPGNELPRLFRLIEDEAVINRMGFNNDGADTMAAVLKKRTSHKIPVAVNIGKNKVTPNELAYEDYRLCIKKLYDEGEFFVVNISSPNTQGLRELQHGNELSNLLHHVNEEMTIQAHARGTAKKAVFVKIAPDMTEEELVHTVESIKNSEVSGIIVSNTTLSRDGLVNSYKSETGGLSGKPLTHRSTEIIRMVYKLTNGQLPIIGSGGIFTAEDAYNKIRAGATLVEIYTSLIYKGPGILREINYGLLQLLKKDGYNHITEVIGADHR